MDSGGWTGVDAEVAYRFHKLRKEHPGVASKRKVNEALYAGMGVRTGWFCGAKPLRETVATLKVRRLSLTMHDPGPGKLHQLLLFKLGKLFLVTAH